MAFVTTQSIRKLSMYAHLPNFNTKICRRQFLKYALYLHIGKGITTVCYLSSRNFRDEIFYDKTSTNVKLDICACNHLISLVKVIKMNCLRIALNHISERGEDIRENLNYTH